MTYLVIKLGGSIISRLPDLFFQNIAELKEKYGCCPVIVHGGGPKINEALEQKKTEIIFHDGLRVSTPEVVETAEMILSGHYNKQIAAKLYQAGGRAFGFSGVDGACMKAEPVKPDGSIGNVGKITQVDGQLIELLCREGYIPVISPISIGQDGTVYNVNADTAAGAVASALHANIIFVSDIPGVMNRHISSTHVYSRLTASETASLIEEEVITGGMIPKVQAALSCLQENVKETVILNGFDSSSLLTYASGGECGTKIMKEEVTYA
jgi:acetylglutamate kinase